MMMMMMNNDEWGEKPRILCAILTIINVHVDHSDQPDGGKKKKRESKKAKGQLRACPRLPRLPIEVNLSPPDRHGILSLGALWQRVIGYLVHSRH